MHVLREYHSVAHIGLLGVIRAKVFRSTGVHGLKFSAYTVKLEVLEEELRGKVKVRIVLEGKIMLNYFKAYEPLY